MRPGGQGKEGQPGMKGEHGKLEGEKGRADIRKNDGCKGSKA